MTQWTTHIPKRDGDAPEGVTLETHFVQCEIEPERWMDCNEGVYWGNDATYRYMPRHAPNVSLFAMAIQHGDEEHRQWLMDAARAWDSGETLPEPRGKGVAATYEQVVAWCKANGRDVPAPLIDYEAWAEVLRVVKWSPNATATEKDKADIESLVAAFKLAMTIPACREVIEG